MRCGSLFSGIGGLDMAVSQFFGADLAWVCEVEKGPCAVLDRHFAVPNLGDISQVDWSEVEPVDILCGGFPCQDISNAGGRAGIKQGTRSGLWFEFARAIRSLRPSYVVVENVANLLAIDNGRGFGTVLGDLAEAGFDAEWCSVRASDVGAPHRRERIFLLAAHPDLDGRLGWGSQPAEVPGLGERAGLHPRPAGSLSASVTSNDGYERAGETRDGWPGPADRDWGAYEPAIERWELVTGRRAPSPVDREGRLAVPFVEWLMGFPPGWMGDLSRSVALKALGNAVVPNQAYYALSRLAA